MRKEPLINDYYYHVYNRGVDKRNLFVTQKDFQRFILSAEIFNDVTPVGSVKEKLSDSRYPVPAGTGYLTEEKLVSIVAFCFNPNHFHFLIKQNVDGGISEYIKRLQGGYTRYFNKVHERSGALFQGKFKAHMVRDENYLNKIRSYVHLNYLVHDIPEENKIFVYSSKSEYDAQKYKITDQKEAEDLLEFYGGLESFQKDSLEIIDMIREERGKVALTEKEVLMP